MRVAAWKRAIVVGASSGIGRALVQQLAGTGCRVAALARRADALERLAAECNTGAPERVRPYPHDVTRPETVPALRDRIRRDLGDPDLLVYSAGVMPRIGLDEYTLATDAAIVAVNLVGAMAWIDAVAPGFAAARTGTIVGISSVAGDRGRSGNPAYHASKAGLDAYLEAVRNRLARLGVAVVTIKAGPVDTPMSRGLDRLPLLIGADAAAQRIVRAARRGGGVRYVPWPWRPIMAVIRGLPGPVFQWLDIR
jgi:short-subunit dehydrogenase